MTCGKPVDLMFVVDGSASISNLCKQGTADACWPFCDGHTTCWEQQINFIAETQAKFDVGPEALQTRVGLVQFGTDANVQFALNKLQTNADVSNAVNNLEYSRCTSKKPDGTDDYNEAGWCKAPQETRTSIAFEVVRDQLMQESAGLRAKEDGVTRVVVVVTDGYPYPDGYEPVALAQQLRDQGVVIIAVGIQQNQQGLQANVDLVGMENLDLAVTVDDFDTLPTQVEALANLICAKAAFVGENDEDGGSDEDGADFNDVPFDWTDPKDDWMEPPDHAGDESETDVSTCANGADDGYMMNLGITATLKLAPREFEAESSQLSINSDGTGGVLLPGDPDALPIDSEQLAAVTNDALRLDGTIGFYVKGNMAKCAKEVSGMFKFELLEPWMKAFGSKRVHVVKFATELQWQGSYPFMSSFTADGTMYLGSYGRAARCLLTGAEDCPGVLALTAQFEYANDEDTGKITFDLEATLTKAEDGSNPLANVYNGVTENQLAGSASQRLTLFGMVDWLFRLEIAATKGGGIDTFEIELTGELTQGQLPPVTDDDDLVDGDCNVVCKYLRKALGEAGTTTVNGKLTIDDGGVDVALGATLADGELVLGTTPDVTLVNMGLKLAFTSRTKAFELRLNADIDVNENLKYRGGIGFTVAAAGGG